MEQLIKRLDEIIKDSGETVSVLVKQLGNQECIYQYNSNQKLVSASTIKVPIMLAVFEEVKKGNTTLDKKILVKENDILSDTAVFENGPDYYSLYELITWMIITSDNTATNVIIKEFGMEQINEYISKVLKLKSTYLERYMLDYDAMEKGLNNYTSQEDMLNIFTKLFNKSILTEELCDIAIEILYNQRIQNQLTRYIYTPLKYAHKTGHLDYLNHDVGAININDKFFYVGVSIYNSKHKDGNKKLMGNLGKTIYEYLSNKI